MDNTALRETQVEGAAPTRTFIALIGTLWMNEGGSGVSYSWDGNTFTSRDDAIKRGFKLRQSDDFNVGVLQDGRLVSLDWMSEAVDSDPALLLEIAEQIGLPNADSLNTPGDAEACGEIHIDANFPYGVTFKPLNLMPHRGFTLGSVTKLYTRPESAVVDESAKLRRCLGFFASVIKSGEPWTDTCEREYTAALGKGER